MRRIVYASQARSSAMGDAFDDLVRTSTHNNARDGVTGLLLFDGRRFLQAIEGADNMVIACFSRIRCDDRHAQIEVLEDVTDEERQFKGWSLRAFELDGHARAFRHEVEEALASIGSARLRATFLGFAALAH